MNEDDDWGDQLGGMTLSVRMTGNDITMQLTGSVNWTAEVAENYLVRMVRQVRELNAGLILDQS